ncbi:DUF3300 domain-containing protein [Variovorax humicola]|uniref:DUF3300 domain-containing protein n=1 Tax=Variovorax humicola TaxID=1769758 RepID=A0ABU8WBA6_9BURK
MKQQPIARGPSPFLASLAIPLMVAGCVVAPAPPGPYVVAPVAGTAPRPAAAATPSAVPAQSSSPFSVEQIDQMMAPIALYPDSLLSQVLMAATYPADVADAARWSKANPDRSGDAAVKAVENEPWDPSVKSLVAFPQVIQIMGDKPDWVQNLGDAFLASSKDVLDSAQRLRSKAQSTGNLKSSEQQRVSAAPDPQTNQNVIVIEPADPQVVYVPTYNPSVVYGTWPYPAYPPYYYYPPAMYYPGAALATGIAFGVGVAATAALWGNCNWGGGNVNINAARYNNVNVNRQISANQSFQHNAANRRGVPYRDSRSQQQFGRNVAGSDQRGDFRGRDTPRDAQRQQAQSALQQRGMDPGQGRDQLRNDAGTRDRAQAAAGGRGDGDFGGGRGGDRNQFGGQGGGVDRVSSRGGDNAFRGAGNAGQAQQQFNRGNSSRQSMGQAGGGARASAGGGFSGGGARGGGGRGGGGGGRGGGGRR